jgi:hypothetical protein
MDRPRGHLSGQPDCGRQQPELLAPLHKCLSLHAEYKAEIHDWVTEKRSRLSTYNKEDDEIHDFLRSPGDSPQYKLWSRLSKDERDPLYRDLAREGILARPDLFARIALQRLAGSCNQNDFKTSRFRAAYYGDSLHEQYYGPPEESMLRIAFGIPRQAPYPSYEELRTRVMPRPDAFLTRFYLKYADAYQAPGDLIDRTSGWPAPLGWATLLGMALSLVPPFLRTLGIWTIAFAGYLFAVYLVGIENHRYFALVWPFVLLLLALIPETAWRGITRNGDRN